MSSNAFERKVAATLRRVPGLWSWHPAEPEGYQAEVPGDFLFGHARGWGLLECKQTSDNRLSPSQWPAHQRTAARQVAAAGGVAWLAVSFRSGKRLFNVEKLAAAHRDGSLGVPFDFAWGHDLAELGSLILLDKAGALM